MAERTITIVGVGALGSHVAQFLRSEKVAIRLIDFDRVETKNTLSQFHGKQGVGKNKAEALRALANFMWGAKWQPLPYELTEHNRAQLLQGVDLEEGSLIIECLDNIKSRRVVQDYAHDYDLPCLHGALAAGGAYGNVMWNECFEPDAEGAAGQATCEDGEFLPFIALVSSYIAIAAQHFLRTGKKLNFGVSPHGVTLI